MDKPGSTGSIIKTLIESRNRITLTIKGRATPEQQEWLDDLDQQLRHWRIVELKEKYKLPSLDRADTIATDEEEP